ncbi:MAG: hypothetical protein KBA51_03090 [Kiritimatiellae bacterium]|nr:hypothetical protein [Kiritimatiellia bacterium]
MNRSLRSPGGERPPPPSEPGASFPRTVSAWEAVVARRWARYAPEGVGPDHDPAVRAVAEFCADTGRGRTDAEMDLLLARALRATGRAADSARAAAGAALLRGPLDSRPESPGTVSLALDRLEPAAAIGELAVYRALRAAVASALDIEGGRRSTIALRGAARLARRMEGARASRRRIRARCEELRRYCAAAAARHAGDDVPAPEVIFWAPMD